jgi:two-component system, NarL family, nitrate/nitrite response regulator NarL
MNLNGDGANMSQEKFERLSRREQEVLLALMRGSTARDICKQSYVSLPTVRSQIHSILSKLGVSSQVAAVALAYRSGWPPERDRLFDGDAVTSAEKSAEVV